MNVGRLKELINNYPDDMPVKYLNMEEDNIFQSDVDYLIEGFVEHYHYKKSTFTEEKCLILSESFVYQESRYNFDNECYPNRIKHEVTKV